MMLLAGVGCLEWCLESGRSKAFIISGRLCQSKQVQPCPLKFHDSSGNLGSQSPGATPLQESCHYSFPPHLAEGEKNYYDPGIQIITYRFRSHHQRFLQAGVGVFLKTRIVKVSYTGKNRNIYYPAVDLRVVRICTQLNKKKDFLHETS